MQPNPYLVQTIWSPQIRTLFQAQFQDMLYMNRVHGLMLVQQGYLSKEHFHVIDSGLRWVKENFTENQIRAELGDLYFNIMDMLNRHIGEETGNLLHVGRSRNDMCCTCGRMQVRREILDSMRQINVTMEQLLNLAGEHIETILPYYTFGQPAQPGTFGHYLLQVFLMLSRDFRRLSNAYRNTNRSPMGAAAGIGTSFVLDQKLTANLLGFDGIMEHTLDAVSASDYILETASAMMVMISGMSRLAQDLFSWASWESGILYCDDSIVAGSSIMPQKRNPICFENMRSQSAKAVGMLSEIIALSHNTTLFPNTEAAVNMLCALAEGMDKCGTVLGLLQNGLAHVSIRRERAEEHVRNCYVIASSLSEQLSQRYDISFSDAHHVVHIIINDLVKNGMDPAELTAKRLQDVFQQELNLTISVTETDLLNYIDPVRSMALITTEGSPGQKHSEKLIMNCREILIRQKAELRQREGLLNDALEETERRCRELR